MNENTLFERIKQLEEILNETKGTEHLNKLLTSIIEKYKNDILMHDGTAKPPPLNELKFILTEPPR